MLKLREGSMDCKDLTTRIDRFQYKGIVYWDIYLDDKFYMTIEEVNFYA